MLEVRIVIDRAFRSTQKKQADLSKTGEEWDLWTKSIKNGLKKYVKTIMQGYMA